MIAQTENVVTIDPINVSESELARRDAERLLDNSRSLKIKTAGEYENAAEFLKCIKRTAKSIEDKRKSITRPLDMAKKSIMDLFRKPLCDLSEAEGLVKRGMLAFSQEQERIRREREAQLREQARREEERKRRQLEERAKKAEASGKVEKAEALRERAEEVFVPTPVVAPTVNRVSGIVEKTVWKYRIVDVNKIPREYMIPDEKAIANIGRATKGRVTIPGVEFYPEKTLAGSRV